MKTIFPLFHLFVFEQLFIVKSPILRITLSIPGELRYGIGTILIRFQKLKSTLS